MVDPAARPRSASSACEPCRAAPAPPRRNVTVRASLFFDGTLNNRANTRTYNASTPAQRASREGSYANDFSNISKLEEVLQMPHAGFDHSFKIYIEGIGTFDGVGDSTPGSALGTGDYGVFAKVERGLARCVTSIRTEIPRDTTIRQIVLDSFGFSRGAAAARLFVHKALNVGDRLAQRLTAAGYTVGTVIVRFVGLFDTVASYGVAHANDTADLNLDAISAAEKVVQLAAGEEHRLNFRLTNIASAGDDGVEHYLPGVHSDVGGGYRDGVSESVQLYDMDVARVGSAERAALDREAAWALDRGWYRLAEFEANRGKPANQMSRTRLENGWNEIRVSRTRISNRYARIPLHIMANYGTQKQLAWSGTLNVRHPVPAPLVAVKAAIERVIRGSPKPNQDTWMNSMAPWHIQLRHAFLHMSAFYGSTAGANAPQWTGGDSVRGRRRRVVQRG
ncbi:MAG: DUF2235 domain-containing protein [Nannocystis sp.]|nr:DUF2235 domain-containing protein [Nannocystis sp.]MBA3548557.1 DUF2235 domain-containing protein [Nannocystis sp.]